jgi:DNA-binding HxlR family transcriptional regulator
MDTIANLRQFGGADAYLRTCPSRGVLDVIGSKWTVLIIAALIDRPLHFGELKRRLDGITQKSLTQALRQLERDGFISRTQYPTIPPRVEYALTPLGCRGGQSAELHPRMGSAQPRRSAHRPRRLRLPPRRAVRPAPRPRRGTMNRSTDWVIAADDAYDGVALFSP